MRPSDGFFQARQAQLIAVGLRLLRRPGGLGRGERLVISALNRGLALLRGFCDLMDSENFLAAAPLVRLQLDSGLRAFALLMTADAHEAAGKVAAGEHLNRLKDREGERLTDKHIVKTVDKHLYPGAAAMYERASGYVHLSDEHFYHAFDIRDPGNRPPDVAIKLGALDKFVTADQRANLIADFGIATDFLAIVAGVWVEMPRGPSENPNAAA